MTPPLFHPPQTHIINMSNLCKQYRNGLDRGASASSGRTVNSYTGKKHNFRHHGETVEQFMRRAGRPGGKSDHDSAPITADTGSKRGGAAVSY